MKNLFNKTILLTAAMVFTVHLQAQVQHEKKEVKSFRVKGSTKVEIENKYGNVIIETWDKDSVLFNVITTVYADNDGDAFELMDRISFSGYNTSEYLSFKTVIQPHKNRLRNFFRNIVQADKSNVKVNYVVFIPKQLDLSIKNKFGDVFLPDYRGRFKLDLAHGDLKANSIDICDIAISFGDVDFNDIEDGKIDISFGDVYLEKAGKIEISGKGSEMELGTVEHLIVDISKGSLNIDHANRIRGSIAFNECRISNLKSSIDLDMKFSDLNIMQIDPLVKTIRITQKSSDVNLNIKVPFTLEAILDGGSVNTLKKGENLKTVFEEKNEKHIRGSFGESPLLNVFLQGSNSQTFIKNE